MIRNSYSSMASRERFHVLFCCALNSELQAARQVLENETDSEFEDAYSDVVSGLSVCRNWNNTPLTIGLIAQAEMGGKGCIARLTELQTKNFSADLAVMSGIMAGEEDVHGGVEYGTVVVGKSTSMEDGGKTLADGEFLAHGDPEKLDKDLSAAIDNVIGRLEGGKEWLESIPRTTQRPSPRYAQELILKKVAAMPDGITIGDLCNELSVGVSQIDEKTWDGILRKMTKTCRWVTVEDGVVKQTETGQSYMRGAFKFPRTDEINVVMGSIGTIPCVTENLPNELQQYKKHMANRKLKGIDMEAHHFMSHSKATFKDCVPLVMKGISDYGTPAKQDYYQKYAASTPVAFLRYLLGQKPVYAG